MSIIDLDALTPVNPENAKEFVGRDTTGNVILVKNNFETSDTKNIHKTGDLSQTGNHIDFTFGKVSMTVSAESDTEIKIIAHSSIPISIDITAFRAGSYGVNTNSHDNISLSSEPVELSTITYYNYISAMAYVTESGSENRQVYHIIATGNSDFSKVDINIDPKI